MEDPVLQYKVLTAVGEAKGKTTQSDIARSISRSVQSVNFALRLLVVKGCIKISGANRLNLRYNLTPKGLFEKTQLAYDFLKKQSALYEEVRMHLLAKLRGLSEDGIRSASIYGWTPFTETAILCLMLEGIQVVAIYVPERIELNWWNSVPFRLIEGFKDDCDILLLLEPLPEEMGETIGTKTMICFPDSDGSEA